MMLWWLLKSLVIVVCVVGSNAALWSHSQGNITACHGDDVTIPWFFTSMPDETVISITWFVKRNGGVTTLFASLTEGEFFPHSRQHVQFAPSAGVQLQNVTVNDTGLYSVHVSTLDSADHVTSYSLSADLNVAAPPVLSGGQLKARRHSAPVLDDVRGVDHVILECGHFIDRGEPPVTVTWRTPSGAVYTNVSYQDGYFLLPLQTVESGSYTCSLTYQSLSRGCLASDSVLIGEAIVYVDENGKWAVREANEGELIAELKSQVQILRQEDQELKSQVQNLTHNQQMLNKEDEELKSQNQNLTHNQQILLQENQELKSQVQTLEQRMTRLEKATCMDIRNHGHSSGTYTLYHGNSTINVYCDQDTDGGGWTVFQRRQDGSVDFFRNWADYRNGFGDLTGEFWLGLDNLHTLTSFRPYELRVDLEAFNGSRAFAGYRGFRIGDVNTNYALYFDDFLGGSAGDSLTYHKGHRFVTKDYGDVYVCAGGYHGAWWYDYCFRSNLNGIYRPRGVSPKYDGVMWSTFTGDDISLKRTEMKIRPM